MLATTEAQKVLPTVVDRCHRFDFQRPTAEQIATVIARTATAEGIEIGPEAVAVLARHASGSFRDALGTLEQLQTYAGEAIALADVLAVLGISDAELLFEALDAVARADPRRALTAAAAAVDGGHDPAAFIRELETHARELLIVQMQDGEVPPELSLTAERDERLAAQAQQLPPAVLVRTLDLLAEALNHLRAGADARTQLELALVKAARADLDPSVTALATRIERLEHGASTLETLAAPAARQRDPGPPAEFRTPAELETPAEFRTPADSQTPADSETSAQSETPADLETPAELRTLAGPAPEPEANGTSAPEATVDAEIDADAGRERQVVSAPADTSLTIERLIALWPEVLENVRAANAMLGAVVDDAHPVELAGDRLVLAFGEDAAFLRKKAEERATRTALTEAVRAVTGHALTFSYELREGHAPPPPQPAQRGRADRALEDRVRRRGARRHRRGGPA